MPRVEPLGKNIEDWCDETDQGTSTHDVCHDCYVDLEDEPDCYNDRLSLDNGEPEPEDGWGGEVDHPCYEEAAEAGSAYRCEVCGDELTGSDN